MNPLLLSIVLSVRIRWLAKLVPGSVRRAQPTRRNRRPNRDAMSHTRRAQIPIGDLKSLAQTELSINPTITVYTVDQDGVEHRRAANPWAGLTATAVKIAASFERLGDAARTLSSQLRQQL